MLAAAAVSRSSSKVLVLFILTRVYVASMQAPRDAKQQIEDAMMAVMEKRHAMDDAAHGQSNNGHAS